MCKQCQLGKMTKYSSKRKIYSYDDILELVHTNLCGPICVQSYRGGKYFNLFLNDYFIMMTMMFLKANMMLFSYLSGI